MSLTLRKGDWKPSAMLVAAALVGVAPLLLGLFLVPPGHLVLHLRDRVFGVDITGRQALVSLDGREVTLSPRPLGAAAVFDFGAVPSGPHQLQWAVEGYAGGGQAVSVAPRARVNATIVEANLMPEFGSLTVKGVDAVTNRGLAAPIEATLAGVQGTASGNSALFPEVARGQHGVKAWARGYCPESATVTVAAGQTTTATMALSPAIAPDEVARFVLQWDQGPGDIDAHVFILASGEKTERHVFWDAKSTEKNGLPMATLDVDRRQPGGFETVTVRKGFSGRFRYQVVNYSLLETRHRKQPLPPRLSASGAQVRLYVSGDCKPRVFTVPASCEDLEWFVVELAVDAAGLVTVTPENQCVPGPPRGQHCNK